MPISSPFLTLNFRELNIIFLELNILNKTRGTTVVEFAWSRMRFFQGRKEMDPNNDGEDVG